MITANNSNRTIAVASGKGGVGKTFITANLSLALAQQTGPHTKVVAVDLDLGARMRASKLKGSSTVDNIEDGML